MIRTDSHHRSRWAPIARRLALLALVLAAGCSDGDSDRPRATPTATVARTATGAPTNTATAPPTGTATVAPTTTLTPVPTPNDSASAACEKLTACQQCFSNGAGQCLSTADCAQRLAADVAICINTASGCPSDMLGDCLFPGCDGTDPSGECE